jgi:nucleoside phosphorylase
MANPAEKPRVGTLVLSAWEPELAPLRRLLRTRVGHDNDVALAAVGVGTVDAAVGATLAIARMNPRRVIFVGTAGVYPASARALPIGTAALAGELRLVSTAALRGDAYTPAPLVSTAETTPALRERMERTSEPPPVATVACPVAITQTAALARRIAATGAALENLEAFAVARAATAARRPFAAVLGISNVVGPRAHAEWRANHQAASRAACHVVWTWLGA